MQLRIYILCKQHPTEHKVSTRGHTWPLCHLWLWHATKSTLYWLLYCNIFKTNTQNSTFHCATDACFVLICCHLSKNVIFCSHLGTSFIHPLPPLSYLDTTYIRHACGVPWWNGWIYLMYETFLYKCDRHGSGLWGDALAICKQDMRSEHMIGMTGEYFVKGVYEGRSERGSVMGRYITSEME